jgi:hypothetical protein
VPDQDVRVDKRTQRDRPARSAQVRRRTSSHRVPRLPARAGTFRGVGTLLTWLYTFGLPGLRARRPATGSCCPNETCDQFGLPAAIEACVENC